VPGTLTELIATGKPDLLRKELWPQIVGLVLEKGGDRDVEYAQRRAQAIYHELTGVFANARIETTTPVPPSQEVRNKVKANLIRFIKSKQKKRASHGVAA
jgi:hypothetical protein